MDKPLIELSEYITIVMVFLVVPVVGFLLLFAGEILLLRKRKWVDEKQTIKYPLITFLINIPVIVISIFVLGVGELLKDGSADKFLDNALSPTASTIAYSILVGIVNFCIVFVVLFLVRWAVTKIMAESSTLTWKYVVGQAALLAALLSIIYPLGQTISTIFLGGMEFY